MEIHIHIENVFISDGAEKQLNGKDIISEKKVNQFIDELFEKLKKVELETGLTEKIIEKPPVPENEKTETSVSVKEQPGKIKKHPAGEFHPEYFMAITDLDKRQVALYNKRFYLKQYKKLTPAIDKEITKMVNECKLLKKKDKPIKFKSKLSPKSKTELEETLKEIEERNKQGYKIGD